MSDSNANTKVETENRRSSRLVRAVPLSVAGVDALGRPFMEQTSTIIVNCHGCRCASKHYVLKNMWVTLEVPPTRAGRSSRRVRARVTSIERPHNLNDWFQVCVELETPGNFWGLDFSPLDWISFGGDAPRGDVPPSVSTDSRPSFERDRGDAPSAINPRQQSADDHLRTLALAAENLAGGKELWATLAVQMAPQGREPRQHLYDTIWEGATDALSAEDRPLITALYAQLQERKGPIQLATRSDAERPNEKGAEQSRCAEQAVLGGLREQWNRELSDSMRNAREQIAAQLHKLEEDRLAALEQQIQERLRTRNEESQAQIDRFDAAARELEQRLTSLIATAESALQTHLEARIADGSWNERIEIAIESVAKRSAEDLARRSQETVDRIESAALSRIEAVSGHFAATSAEIERTIAARMLALEKEWTDAIASAEVKIAALLSSLDAVEKHVQRTLTDRDTCSKDEPEKKNAAEPQ